MILPERYPDTWKDANIIIPKEDKNGKDPKNDRLISLLNMDYKIFGDFTDGKNGHSQDDDSSKFYFSVPKPTKIVNSKAFQRWEKLSKYVWQGKRNEN